MLNKLVENKILYNEVVIVLKSGKKHVLIKNLTISDITRRIKHIKFTEILKNLGDLRTLKRQYFCADLKKTGQKYCQKG